MGELGEVPVAVPAAKPNGKPPSPSFHIQSASGEPIEIPNGEYYFNTKARARRMMLNSLSNEARRVYACLEVHTIGWKREKALIGKRFITREEISSETGLKVQNVSRALTELHDAGLGECRQSADDRRKIEIYSWAFPRKVEQKNTNRARFVSPSWLPDDCKSLKSYLSHKKIRLLEDLPEDMDDDARDSFLKDVSGIARELEELEIRIARLLETNRATIPLNKEYRTYRITTRTEEREGGVDPKPVAEPKPTIAPPPPSSLSEDSDEICMATRVRGALPGDNAKFRRFPPARNQPSPDREVSRSNRPDPETARDQDLGGRQDNGAISVPRSEIVVSNPKSTELFEVFCFIMKGCGRPVSVERMPACRQKFFHYPLETQQRIVDDATIRSQGKWDRAEYVTDPLKYLGSRIWDTEPITRRTFPTSKTTAEQERLDVLRQEMERAIRLDKELGPLP